mgnify:CR=1 FL=1
MLESNNQAINQGVEQKVKSYLKHKFENIGGKFITVPEPYTSKTCPVCGKDGKFYVNTETGAFICFRASCDTQGGLRDLIKLLGDTENGVNIETSEKPREIQDPEPIALEPVEDYHKNLLEKYSPLEKYFAETRGYTVETVKGFKLGWDGRNILIPIFDEQGNLLETTGSGRP